MKEKIDFEKAEMIWKLFRQNRNPFDIQKIIKEKYHITLNRTYLYKIKDDFEMSIKASDIFQSMFDPKYQNLEYKRKTLMIVHLLRPETKNIIVDKYHEYHDEFVRSFKEKLALFKE